MFIFIFFKWGVYINFLGENKFFFKVIQVIYQKLKSSVCSNILFWESISEKKEIYLKKHF